MLMRKIYGSKYTKQITKIFRVPTFYWMMLVAFFRGMVHVNVPSLHSMLTIKERRMWYKSEVNWALIFKRQASRDLWDSSSYYHRTIPRALHWSTWTSLRTKKWSTWSITWKQEIGSCSNMCMIGTRQAMRSLSILTNIIFWQCWPRYIIYFVNNHQSHSKNYLAQAVKCQLLKECNHLIKFTKRPKEARIWDKILIISTHLQS